jgi:hypothetical protein
MESNLKNNRQQEGRRRSFGMTSTSYINIEKHSKYLHTSQAEQ